MALFDDVERDYEGPISAGETHFAYLNRSARPEVGRIRQFLNDCLDRFPVEHRAGLTARLKSNDRVHESALFELVVHELLLRAGHTVLAVEPPLEHTPKSPDFLVQSPTDEQFYLECVVAKPSTMMERSSKLFSLAPRLKRALAVTRAPNTKLS